MEYIAIGHLQINGVESAGAVSVGPKLVVGNKSHSKSTTGAGHINGDRSSIPMVAGHIDDSDWIDAVAWYGVIPPG
jgi:hypothetical protein